MLSPARCLSMALLSLSIAGGFSIPNVASAEVTLKKLDGRVRVEINGQLFTEYLYEAWYFPYCYPVIGPNGAPVTRHYPMEEGVEGESTDHEHHRSLWFAHGLVNGRDFWAPQSPREGHKRRIVQESIEKAESGETSGTLVVINRWEVDGVPMLRERREMVFTPLENGEVLLDYNTALTAVDGPVTFGDAKDGGMAVRVAGDMKVKGHKGFEDQGKGHIVTSEGAKDEASWGTRAKWADYYGPDPSGQVAGIALFDHPENLRYPTWWHARTYGLIAANRFGTGYFEEKNGAKRGDGDYTLPAGETLTLRHRLYFHHRTAEEAKVAEKYDEYVRGKE